MMDIGDTIITTSGKPTLSPDMGPWGAPQNTLHICVRGTVLGSSCPIAATCTAPHSMGTWIDPHTMQRKECEPPRSGSKSQPYPAGHKAPFICSSKVLS